MNYQKIYDQLVQQNHNFKDGEYFETHHKVPRCMGGTDDTSNIVNLTAREHYIAHLLLVKITEQNGDKFAYGKMLYAFNCMKWGRCDGERSFKYNSKLYQVVKEQYSKLRCAMMKTKTNPMHNKIWIHSDELRKNKCWCKELPIPNGWELGRIFNWNKHFERISKKYRKQTNRLNRIKQIQEIANYYMEYGFEKTKLQYADESITKSMVLLLKTFAYYKQHYGINFIARNNTPGVVNGSYFKKD